jgi:hypothetical protein
MRKCLEATDCSILPLNQSEALQKASTMKYELMLLWEAEGG